MDTVPTRSAAPVSPGDLAERLRTRRRWALGASGSAAVVVVSGSVQALSFLRSVRPEEES
ncbi:hypothetical protein [Isoptericola sp. b408]|uniref:hypothetical protein n=1 Tax=Isoptericola sp. b408 TaxID=3064653 RepID=UPI00271398F0|nr:hypothetical protein [Isoptericola sp. b408]MDO8150080.1 hypothetical protein [Isoptericola sp. b408]